jgi:hypothetical protein
MFAETQCLLLFYMKHSSYFIWSILPLHVALVLTMFAETQCLLLFYMKHSSSSHRNSPDVWLFWIAILKRSVITHHICSRSVGDKPNSCIHRAKSNQSDRIKALTLTTLNWNCFSERQLLVSVYNSRSQHYNHLVSINSCSVLGIPPWYITWVSQFL